MQAYGHRDLLKTLNATLESHRRSPDNIKRIVAERQHASP